MTPVPGVDPTKGGYYIWRYLPNKGASVVFLLLFLTAFIFMCWKIWKTRVRFCIVFAIGCLFEFIGFAARTAAHNKTGRIMPYAIQSMYILVAPALFAASIYMTLSRIVLAVQGSKYSLIKPSRVTAIFVGGDIATFMIQGGGAGLMVVQKAGFATWGERAILIGLVVQVLLFGFFTCVALIFHRRMRQAPTTQSLSSTIPWEQTLIMLYAVSALIMIRSIFRVIEYAQGQTGYCLSHEWTLYIFDALPMFIVTILYGWRFPSELKRKEMESYGI
ncbi:RTA1 like protein-domain-containing protein [Ilyonectria destructans]|nr:RTA1 like protein-domain-containing protein [Ilyonectria destructans]